MFNYCPPPPPPEKAKRSLHAFVLQPYVAEITPSTYRGATGGQFQNGVNMGIFISLLISPYLPWRTLSVIGLVFGCVMGIGLMFMHESPVWLLSTRQLERYEKSSRFFAGKTHVLYPEFAPATTEVNPEKKYSLKYDDLANSSFSLPLLPPPPPPKLSGPSKKFCAPISRNVLHNSNLHNNTKYAGIKTLVKTEQISSSLWSYFIDVVDYGYSAFHKISQNIDAVSNNAFSSTNTKFDKQAVYCPNLNSFT